MIKKGTRDEVKDFIKTLIPITDFSTLKKGDKIFHESSLSMRFADTFERIEGSSVYYRNSSGELWTAPTDDWYYYQEPELPKVKGIVFQTGENSFYEWKGFSLTPKEEDTIMQIFQRHEQEGTISSIQG